MTSYSALSPVSAGIYTALSVVAVTALAVGGVCDDVAQSTAVPFLLYVVSEKSLGGLGSQPGRAGFVDEIALRLHAFTEYQGGKVGQQICDAAIGAVLVAFDADAPTVTIVGYRVCDCVWHETSEPFDSDVGGVKVKETVSQMTLRVQLT